jgi:hypothetical protein
MSRITTRAKPERAALTRKKIGVIEVVQRMRAVEKLNTKPTNPWEPKATGRPRSPQNLAFWISSWKRYQMYTEPRKG